MRNLKPTNVLIIKDMDIQISDAGLSSIITPSIISNAQAKDKAWMAPEVDNNNQNAKCDVWSVGAIAYWLLSGQEP